jgi:hypothetical protein
MLLAAAAAAAAAADDDGGGGRMEEQRHFQKTHGPNRTLLPASVINSTTRKRF